MESQTSTATTQNPCNNSELPQKRGNVQTHRLQAVCGYDNRVNDIIYCPAQLEASKVKIEPTVVYFGGDIQDYAENMENRRDGKKYMQWNLEETIQLLHRKFPMSHVVVVKPNRMEYSSFSCFKNFVECNSFGIPDHCPNYHAIDHLEQLLTNISIRISADEKELLAMSDLILIGFSKGCVVLNQLMHEFTYRINTDTNQASCLIGRVREIYWLDGGHSGGRNTWITSEPILQTIAQLRSIYAVHVHVTPYQVEDTRRPWIRKEERLFSNTLTRLGAPLHRELHFSGGTDVDVDTNMHFNVLNVFKADVL